MQILRAGLDLDAFFRRLRIAPARVLLLDYDGTLAPFHVDPARAMPYPGVVPALDEIMESGATRLSIVSGRATRQLIPLLGLRRIPEVWGSHGFERLHPETGYRAGRLAPPVRELLDGIEAWAGRIEALGGRCERKPASVAFHWRGLDNAARAEIRNVVFGQWMNLGYAGSLMWHDFDGGIELRAPGRDKGDVVRAIAAETDAGTVLAYLGDDMTDETAFEAMPPDGLAVLVRPALRPTGAQLWLRPPEELLGFLARWRAASGGAPA